MKDRKYSRPPAERHCSPPKPGAPPLLTLIFRCHFLWTGQSPPSRNPSKPWWSLAGYCSSRRPLLQAGRPRRRDCSHSQSCAHALCVHTCVCVCARARVCERGPELFLHQLLRQGLLPSPIHPRPFSRCPSILEGCLPGREAPSRAAFKPLLFVTRSWSTGGSLAQCHRLMWQSWTKPPGTHRSRPSAPPRPPAMEAESERRAAGEGRAC